MHMKVFRKIELQGCTSYTHTHMQLYGNTCFTLMTSSSMMGSWGIFHRLSSVAVKRPPPIPSPSAVMYTTPGLAPPDPPLPQLLEMPGVGHLRAVVTLSVSRIESRPFEALL